MHGHNGVWRKYKKAGDTETKPMPAALVHELSQDNTFHPNVELYLTSNGWRRGTGGVIAGWPLFHRDGRYKNMLLALLTQLRDDRTDRATHSPRNTPSTVADLLSATRIRTDSASINGHADTARARR